MKEFIKSLQDKGVPVFFIRDGGKPSVTLTLVVMSATFVMLGLINGFAKFTKGVDMQSALYWHGMALGAYLGRKFSKKEGLGDASSAPEKKED